VFIHGGEAVTRGGDVHRVPKRVLVSTLQVLLQTGRLKFAEGLLLGIGCWLADRQRYTRRFRFISI
jgi:hypothetical protein